MCHRILQWLGDYVVIVLSGALISESVLQIFKKTFHGCAVIDITMVELLVR